MELPDKLRILADAAKFDASCASSGAKRSNGGKGLGNATGMGICHSYTPDGRCVSLLKILLTNVCVHDCRYCVSRASNDVPRAAFTVDEVVRLTIDFTKRNVIEGLFLSSGVAGSADATMERLTEVARRLREEEGFAGYVHLKAVVGASSEAIRLAGRWADRVSANIEMARQEDLDRLAPERTMASAEGAMGALGREIETSRAERRSHTGRRNKARPFAPAGQSTQMIVGATATPDRTVLSTADRLYTRHRLRRVYYTAYSPIPSAHHDLPTKAPPLVREHRLYQADWLLRFYGFGVDELVTDDVGNLDLRVDPKTAWALAHRELFPLDVNAASREELLRVPGLGTRSVAKILAARRHRALRMSDLKRLRAPMKRVAPFVVTADDWSGARHVDDPDLSERVVTRDTQLLLFDAASSARAGQL